MAKAEAYVSTLDGKYPIDSKQLNELIRLAREDQRDHDIKFIYEARKEFQQAYVSKLKAGNDLAFIEERIADEFRMLANSLSGKNALEIVLKKGWENYNLDDYVILHEKNHDVLPKDWVKNSRGVYRVVDRKDGEATIMDAFGTKFTRPDWYFTKASHRELEIYFKIDINKYRVNLNMMNTKFIMEAITVKEKVFDFSLSEEEFEKKYGYYKHDMENSIINLFNTISTFRAENVQGEDKGQG